jgi:pseudoazurin
MKDILKSLAIALSLWMVASGIILASTVGYALAETTTIEMLNKRDDGAKMVYSQDIAEIAVGDSIIWVPTSKGHNVQFIAAPEGFDIPKKSKNSKEVTIEFNTPGVYYYLCTPHKAMGMIGLVVVGGDTSNKDEVAKAKALGKSKKKLKALLAELG